MLIKAQNIHKVYNDGKRKLHVLKGIDISLKRGEIVAVIGPSGAGKSTLLHILGGLDKPSDGKVVFDGTDLYAIGDNKRSLIRNRRFGFVFQFYHLLPEFTAIENVILPAMIGSACYDKDKRKVQGFRSRLIEKAKELLISVGIRGRQDHRPSELSGGEAQKVAIARALINEPDILFCDEPTGNLDSKSSEIILELIKDLNKRLNQTFLIVTHNEKLANFADRVVYIKDGSIV